MTSRMLFVAVALLALAGCGAKNDQAEKNAASVQDDAANGGAASEGLSAERALVDRNAGHSELSAAQKIGGAEGRSPFEGDRVIGLNAIVRRSLDISREFDKAAPGIRAAVEAAAAGGDRAAADQSLKSMDDLYARAKAALDDMTAAEQELKESGEYYDDAIFYGMQKFVSDVEIELREEKAALLAKLGG